MLDPETQNTASLFETEILLTLQKSIYAMGWYWDDLPEDHFKIVQPTLPGQVIKPPSQTSSISLRNCDIITIQCRRESIIFTAYKDKFISINDIFREVHRKVPRLDLEKSFQNFVETISNYKKGKKVDSGEMSIAEYNSSTYKFPDAFLNFFKIGGLSLKMLSFDLDKTSLV